MKKNKKNNRSIKQAICANDIVKQKTLIDMYLENFNIGDTVLITQTGAKSAEKAKAKKGLIVDKYSFFILVEFDKGFKESFGFQPDTTKISVLKNVSEALYA